MLATCTWSCPHTPAYWRKKIKPVAVPVGFKVVNGSRRIGKQQAVSRPESSLKDREAALAAPLQKRAGSHAGVRDAARIRGASALAAAFA